MIQMVTYGLIAAISPVAIMVLVSLMMTKKPMKNALAFLLGFTLVLVALGVVAVFVLHVGAGKGNHKVDAWIDIILGALCLALIPLSLRKKKDKPEKDRARPFTATKAFSVGVVTMCINTSTMIVFIAGAHAIVMAHLGTAQDVLALAVLTLITLVTLVVPIVIYALFPAKADKLLGSLRVWLVKRQKLIGVAILVIFGIYLLVKGINTLV